MASTSPSILTHVDLDPSEQITVCGSPPIPIPDFHRGPSSISKLSGYDKPDQATLIEWLGLSKIDGSHWGRGRDRRSLSEDGFRSLAICATFLAAVQSQVLSLTAASFPSSKLVTGFFIVGLVIDIIGALLSFASARWFEMLNDDETTFLQGCSDEGLGTRERDRAKPNPHDSSKDVDFVARWVSTSIYISPYVVILGMVTFILGFMVYVWVTQPLATKVTLYIVCGIAALFAPAFAFPHERMRVITHLRFKRRSG